MTMERRRRTFEEIVELMYSIPRYDRKGRRVYRRSEWEQLPRWRRWRDIVLGWVPPREWRYPSKDA